MMMKIHTMNCLNQIIGGINRIGDYVESNRKNYTTNDRADREVTAILDEVEEILQDEFHSIDISFKILASWLERVCNRAIELNDPALIESLKGMCLISEAEKADL